MGENENEGSGGGTETNAHYAADPSAQRRLPFDHHDHLSCCMATPSFTQTELERALSEQTFGIETYKILSNDVLESTAEVVTLEGAKITLTLSTRGYQVRLSFCVPFPHYENA